MQTKQCSKCGEVKRLEAFVKNKKCKNGYAGTCKACANKAKAKYQKTDKGKATQARYRQSEKYKATYKRWTKTETFKAGQKRYATKIPPAVYKIECLKNGRVYIGSSLTPIRRQSIHWSMLKAGSHDNPSLQEDYNLYGREAFIFTIVQEASEDVLRGIEQDYINRGTNLYNEKDALVN